MALSRSGPALRSKAPTMYILAQQCTRISGSHYSQANQIVLPSSRIKLRFAWQRSSRFRARKHHPSLHILLTKQSPCSMLLAASTRPHAGAFGGRKVANPIRRASTSPRRLLVNPRAEVCSRGKVVLRSPFALSLLPNCEHFAELCCCARAGLRQEFEAHVSPSKSGPGKV